MLFSDAPQDLSNVLQIGNGAVNNIELQGFSRWVDISLGGDDLDIYVDNNVCVIDPLNTGNVLSIGPTNNKDIRLNKIGLGGSPISANFFINYVQSNTARGALQFDQTYTGATFGLGAFITLTYQGTATNSFGVSISGVTEDGSNTVTTRSLGWRNTVGIEGTTTYGNASTIRNFNMIEFFWSGNGGTHTAGTVRRQCLIAEAFTSLSGVTVFDSFMNTAMDCIIRDNVFLYLTGTASTKGTSHLRYSTANSAIEVTSGGNLAYQVLSTGTRFGTAANGLSISNAGVMTHAGTAGYQVGNDRFAFQSALLPVVGLRFQLTGVIGFSFTDLAGVEMANLSLSNGIKSVRGFCPTETSPTTLGASANNLAVSQSGFVRLSASTPVNITGIAAPGEGLNRDMLLFNVGGANNITLTHEDAASTATNRFRSVTLANIVLAPDEGARAIYDVTTGRWRLWKL